MADGPTLILLMKAMEADFFSDFLRRLAPQLNLVRADSVEDLERLLPAPTQGVRIMAFSTNVIVPPEILQRITYNAINFHPGPPEFPGYRPTGFALYKGARRYGVTAHYMTDRVDEGPIVGAERFPVAADAWLIDVVKEAYQRLARLALGLLPQLTQISRPVDTLTERWSPSKTTRAQYDAMRRIAPDMEDAELRLRFRCFDGIYTDLEDRPAPAAEDYPASMPTASKRSVS